MQNSTRNIKGTNEVTRQDYGYCNQFRPMMRMTWLFSGKLWPAKKARNEPAIENKKEFRKRKNSPNLKVKSS